MNAPPDRESLLALIATLRTGRGYLHKTDIAAAAGTLEAVPGVAGDDGHGLGDDCAVLRVPGGGEGWLLFAMEGLVEELVAQAPWFAGFCSVLVNLSDVAAMGGRALAVADALWARDARHGAEVLAGIGAAARAFGVPVAGGHSNYRAQREQLAVAVTGHARRLLTSFDARPGDRLLMAVDLRGDWVAPWPYWDAATRAPAERLRGDLELLPRLAEDGLSRAAKDISMAGIAGTALMFAECSRAGLVIELDAIPAPPGVEAAHWLAAFPSYGYLLAAAPAQAEAVLERFRARGIAAADIGGFEPGSSVRLESRRAGAVAGFHDWRQQPFIRPPAVGSG